MRKEFKFLFGALGLFALASCSNDDLQGVNGGEYDYSNKIVIRADVPAESEDGGMRAYNDGDEGTTFRWVEGDKLRAYDGLMQMYDEFGVEGNFFTLPRANATIKDPAGYKYFLFAEDGSISWAGWNGANVALVRIGKHVDENGDVKDGINYAEDSKIAQNGTVLYKYAVPMYAFPETEPTEGEGNAVNIEANFKRMTGLAKVVFENGSNSGATAVRARALKAKSADNNAAKEMAEIATKALEEAAKTNADVVFDNLSLSIGGTTFKDLTEKDETKKMSGWFQAELDKEDADKSILKEVTDKTGAINTGDNQSEIVVNIPEQSMNTYTNVVYLPLIINTYDLLVFEYTKDGTTWNLLRVLNNFEVPRANVVGRMTVKSQMSAVVKTLEDLQDVINRAAKVGADIDVSVTIKKDGSGTGNIEVPTSGVLTLPADLKHVVNLNITEESGAIGLEANASNVLTIKNETGATGKLVFNGATFNTPIAINAAGARIGLAGKAEKSVVVNSADSLIFGEFMFNEEPAAANRLDFKSVPVVVTGKVGFKNNVPGFKTEGDILVQEGGNVDCTFEGKNVTLEKGAKAWNIIATGDVVADSAVINSITVTDGTVTIDNEEKDGELALEIKKISMTGNGKIVLKNGFVKEINNEDADGEATEITIESAGKSAIASVKNVDEATITSTWNGEYYSKGFANSNDTYNAYWNNGDIYTATQLAVLRDIYVGKLYADIKLNENGKTDNLWKGLTRYNNFLGNGHTISNIVLDVDVEEGTPATGFFNLVKTNQTNGSTDVLIDSLNITGLTAEGTLIETGALIGTAWATNNYKITIKDVNVKDVALNGDGDSYAVGGMIGFVKGLGTVETAGDNNVEAVVKGYYQLGVVIGTIGSTSAKPVVILGQDSKHGVHILANSAISVTKEFKTDTDQDANAGKVGIVVGELFGTLNAGYVGSSMKNENDWRYDLCTIYVYNGESTTQKKLLHFKGGYGTKQGTYQYFVGYSPEAEEYTKGENKQSKLYDGVNERYTAPAAKDKINAYNVFE